VRVETADRRREQYLRETGRTAKAMEPPMPLLPRHLPPRPIGKPREPRTAVEISESDGYRAGFYNQQGTDTTYRTGAEYIAWYAGWKKGQEKRK
jgi:hypothetical protein